MAITKEQKEIAITGVLILVLVVVLAGSLKKKKPRGAPGGEPAKTEVPSRPAAVPVKQTRSADDKTLDEQKERAEGIDWERDPFQELSDEEEQEFELMLKGVSLGQNKKGYAFINDEIVKEGDSFNEYEVIRIEKDKILLKKDEQSFYLVFPPEE